MTIQLTVIGLNQIGVSIGLALANNSYNIQRIGSDVDIAFEQKALKMGAFDKVVHNLPSAVSEADIIILSVPVDEIEKTVEMIAQDLKEGAVILNTAPINIPIFKLIKSIIPPERYFLTFAPTLNPKYLAQDDRSIDAAHADLFQNSLFLISSPVSTHEDAIKLASDLSSTLGAKSYFADPYEADGLIAAVEKLPQLTAAAMITAITTQPGWREGQKLAAQAFLEGTEPAAHLSEVKYFGQSALMNSENTIRMIDSLITELYAVRELLATQESDGLTKYMSKAHDTRAAWLNHREKALWDISSEKAPEPPTAGQVFGRLFGLGGRTKGQDKTKK